jgi:hypothetical protein
MYTMEEFRDDVSAVVAYMWTEKVRDYKECLRNENGAEGHIFLTLKRLADFVDGEDEPEFCYECGADIPLDAASVGGDWHERSCSCFVADADDARTSTDSGAGPPWTKADTAGVSNANGARPARQLSGRPS